jgi:hypothetical protein
MGKHKRLDNGHSARVALTPTPFTYITGNILREEE